jgi:hypothetical protein
MNRLPTVLIFHIQQFGLLTHQYLHPTQVSHGGGVIED